MANDVDKDRVADTTRNASILDFSAYKERAANPARAAQAYIDPRVRVLTLWIFAGLILFFLIFRRA